MRQPPAFEIRCDPRLIARFRSEAKKRFPKETYGVFVGVIEEPDVVSVEELLICPTERQKATQWIVVPDENWLAEVQRRASVENLTVVGDIHSHCTRNADGFFCETAPSEGDWLAVPRCQYLFGGSYTFMAVMALHKAAVKLRSRVNFWPLLPPVRIFWRENE